MNRYDTAIFKELVELQNGHFENIDIVSITGFMDDEQLAAHVAVYRKRAKQEGV